MPIERADVVLAQPSVIPEFLVLGLAPVRSHLIIAGPAKIGKSYLTLELISCLMRGVSFLDIFRVPKPRSVTLIQGEMPPEYFKELRLRALQSVCQNGTLKNLYLEQTTQLRLSNPTSVARLKQELGTVGTELFWMDPFYTCHEGSFNNAQDVNQTLGTFNFLGEAVHSATGFTAHFRKQQTNRSGKRMPQDFQDIAGSFLFEAWADSIITVTPIDSMLGQQVGQQPDEDDLYAKLRLSFWNRWLPPMGDIEGHISITPPFFRVTECSPRMRILRELCSGKSATYSAIAKRASVGHQRTQAFLEHLVRMKLVAKAGNDYFYC